MLSRHAGSLCYGLDHITIFRAINQFFSSSLWKAPHHSMSLYAPSTNTCLLGCELYGLHEWATAWFPATKLYTHAHIHTWATRCELYELLRSTNYTGSSTVHNMHAAIFYYIAYLHIHVFRGWAMGYEWASSWSVWRAQNYDTDKTPKCCIAIDLTLIVFRCPASNPTIE